MPHSIILPWLQSMSKTCMLRQHCTCAKRALRCPQSLSHWHMCSALLQAAAHHLRASPALFGCRCGNRTGC